MNGAIADWDPAHPDHVLPASLFLTAAPAFFAARAWPWIDPQGATEAERAKILPARERFDAGTPFAP